MASSFTPTVKSSAAIGCSSDAECCRRLLLAARSLGLTGQWLSIKDSAHFFLPMLHGWSAGDPATEPRHSLVQLFWELMDSEVDPHLVHAQLYTYHDEFAPDIGQRSVLSRGSPSR